MFLATGIGSPAPPSRRRPVRRKVSDDGALYYRARGSGSATGSVVMITYANVPPSITSHPANRTVTSGGGTYAFQRWSDGGAAQHTIATPASNTT